MEKGRIDTFIQQARDRKTSDTTSMTIIKDFLICDSGKGLIAIQIEYLNEVIELKDRKEVVPLPFIPEYISGIIDVRGEIIPVISLLSIIGEKSGEEDYIKGVVIENNIKVCFLFFDIIGLLSIDIKKIKSVKDVRKNLYYNEEFEYEGENVIILDIPALFESDYLS
ncbi:MAG: chemotaxis protein CheW [Spirochaetales bacterium]|nr:chemotaxis protein CheW [Spirochaetales bacterium]